MNRLKASLWRGLRQMATRKIYIVMMMIVPLGCTWFLLDLMNEGLPLPVPVAVVDMDRSSLSRQVTRTLGANQFVEISSEPLSYAEAMEGVKRGEIFGFFYIPVRFQERAVGGDGPVLSFYSNMSLFVPGTMSFKGFKTTAVATKGGLVMTTMAAAGVGGEEARAMLQPVVVDSHPIGNPWLNYSIYLCNSFGPGVLALMVMLVTAFSICTDIKHGTSPRWLATAGGSIYIALAGKLIPQAVVFSVTGIAMQSLFFGYYHFPLNNHLMHMIVAVVLMVIACQAFAVIICEFVPNLRLALSVCSLIGILSFSVTGFSFPVEQMYGAVGIFSYIVPLRYYFLIYVDQALNGIPLYYSRVWYAALLLFPLLALPAAGRLRKRCLTPVYVP